MFAGITKLITVLPADAYHFRKLIMFMDRKDLFASFARHTGDETDGKGIGKQVLDLKNLQPIHGVRILSAYVILQANFFV